MKTRVTPQQIIKLVEKLPDADKHIHIEDGKHYITQEWLVGTFAGRAFEGETLEDAAQKLIDYLYEHIDHDSMVGNAITRSGFPYLNSVERYCTPVVEEETIPTIYLQKRKIDRVQKENALIG
jgi:hypothetical protein